MHRGGAGNELLAIGVTGLLDLPGYRQLRDDIGVTGALRATSVGPRLMNG
jgi:hypothetical protein